VCKSQAQGGQRCAGDARKYMETSAAKMEAVLDDLVDGKATQADYDAATAAYHEDVKKFASTLEGAAEMRAELAAYEATDNADPARVAAAKAMIDDGAKIAHVNRAIENVHRAAHGKAPLTTPLPQTFAREQAAAAQAAAEAERKAAWAADPLGLRAAEGSAATEPRTLNYPSLALDGWTFAPGAEDNLHRR
jgi:hypothetical protein